jgi:hypothetical protein
MRKGSPISMLVTNKTGRLLGCLTRIKLHNLCRSYKQNILGCLFDDTSSYSDFIACNEWLLLDKGPERIWGKVILK